MKERILPARKVFRLPGQYDQHVRIMDGIMALFIVSPFSHRRTIVGLRYGGDIIPAGQQLFGLEPLTRVTLHKGVEVTTFDLLEQQRRDIAIAHEWLRLSGNADCSERLAHFLCETAHRQCVFEPGETIKSMPLHFTQQMMAEITGQTSVNVNRVLSGFNQRGLLSHSRVRVEFHDFAELARTGGFDPAYLEV
jgi:hypothetical protein